MTESPASPPPPRVSPYAYPLDDFYAQAGMPLPHIEPVQGDRVPAPYRALLVHERDMTPTLEQFHSGSVHIRVLRSETRGEFYFREVVLALDGSEKPVEFGAIKINLPLFSPAARKLILAEREPLGHVLRDCGVAHTSRPKAFIRLASDDFINRALGLAVSQTLYGRRNTLLDPQQRPLADIVEILPPVL